MGNDGGSPPNERHGSAVCQSRLFLESSGYKFYVCVPSQFIPKGNSPLAVARDKEMPPTETDSQEIVKGKEHWREADSLMTITFPNYQLVNVSSKSVVTAQDRGYQFSLIPSNESETWFSIKKQFKLSREPVSLISRSSVSSQSWRKSSKSSKVISWLSMFILSFLARVGSASIGHPDSNMRRRSCR